MTYRGAKAYQQTNVTTTDPATLILMLYEGAIRNLLRAREGIRENDIRKRGEHMSKAIAIITELLSSVQGDEDNEVAGFLKNMYSAMLAELVKVNLSNDPKPVELSIKYLAQMKDIWEKEVMNGDGRKALEEQKAGERKNGPAIYGRDDKGGVDTVINAGASRYCSSGLAVTA